SVTLYSASVIFCLFPLKPLILDIVCPLNDSRPKTFALQTDYSIYGINANDNHFMITMHGLFTVTILIHFIVTIDTFMLIIVLHCCGLFESIRADFFPERQYKIVCDGIIIHHRAITLAESIETSFTIMYGFLVLITMILISVVGLQTIMNFNDPTEVIRCAAFGATLSLHLFFISMPGQELYDHSNRASEIIYSCNWSGMSLKAKRLISIMLMRSMKPMRMTAAKFYPQNMESFGKVLKTSFSFFTVMLSSQ
ncbi:odorant receptor 160NTE, partial [Diachasma alloeum]